ncbi:hypothetical protein PQR14_13885 [Paraburkholderia bryophila]|uniref:hypothetical protein n=1 Tax=Paraburkholderia bryophila TaxID=420952 RepID=UPI0038B9C51A
MAFVIMAFVVVVVVVVVVVRGVVMPGVPVGTGFGLFGTVCFGVVGVRHGGFLVRFVV